MANRPELQTTRDKFERVVSNKGIKRDIRENKRAEAEERNANSTPDKRRAYWRGLGFTRQSHCARVVLDTVTDVNEQAKINKQRSADWPLVTDDLGIGWDGENVIFADQADRAEKPL